MKNAPISVYLNKIYLNYHRFIKILRNLLKMRFKYYFIFFLILVVNFSYGQLSSGGFPLQVVSLKSSKINAVKLPELKQSVIDSLKRNNSSTDSHLKPFTFAHAFKVNYNASNSGQWYSTNAGYNVWKLTIQSDDAKSLNLIFSDFELPQKARLFVYNEDENYYLGAFTEQNNKASRKFAVSPVAGDKITIQYEVPEDAGTPVDFTIERVNHDFTGILKYVRRPYYGEAAGECNIDINCDIGEPWHQLKDAVCRLIVDGTEICSGTLINNTAEDQTPYIISAAHCYDEWDLAETTIYTFNYESPYCAPLDGDPIKTLSGAVMKAHFDSLDFALAVMDDIPPPSYRPYFAGWNRSGEISDSSLSIHHPYGDIKKIAIENDPLSISNFTRKNPRAEYIKQAFWEVSRWDAGVTEIGSSGGALFNTKEQLIGTLTGGSALCGNPINDYFSRFDLQWDYKSDSTKQLKCWLDPINAGNVTLDGRQFNADEDLCDAFTNLNDNDEHANVRLTVSGEFSGYWGGTNNVGITEFVERFSIPGNETLDGISFGVGKLHASNQGPDSKITVKVYNGNAYPETLIYYKTVNINFFAEDAMNYVFFNETVEPADTFFVGFELSDMQDQDTVVIYQSLRTGNNPENHFYFYQNNQWQNFKESNQDDYGMVNVMELIACDYDEITDTPNVELPAANVWLYPNPAQSEINVESDDKIMSETVTVYNMIGQEIDVEVTSIDPYRIKVDLSGSTPGVYFVRFNYKDSYVTRKISFVPNY